MQGLLVNAAMQANLERRTASGQAVRFRPAGNFIAAGFFNGTCTMVVAPGSRILGAVAVETSKRRGVKSLVNRICADALGFQRGNQRTCLPKAMLN